MIRQEVLERLLEIGVGPDLVRSVPHFPADIEGLVVYGSQARGDSVPDSDLDLLALVRNSRVSLRSGPTTISYYTLEQLRTGIGTLFGAHLRRDAKVLWDASGALAEAIESMGEVDTERLMARTLTMSQLFTSPDKDLPKYLYGLSRQARYLLRSCLYAQAIAEQRPCFSVRELAVRHSDARLAELLASRQKTHPTRSDLMECLERLRRIIGEFPPNKHGSLEATIVNEWGQGSDLLSMAFMSLGSIPGASDYAEVEKILL